MLFDHFQQVKSQPVILDAVGLVEGRVLRQAQDDERSRSRLRRG
jgi:hypothetical protein